MILVEIFSTPGCGKCAQAREALRAVAESLSAVRWREVNILDELDYAVDLGVLSLPAIAIDGELVFPTLPGAERLRQELMRRLAGAH
ncbi:glutaredoxin family protein [Pelomicrobium sp.]|jgi:glutaredoxin|uniref:glutaredoxin family protein n=1 Tax=Pelomicrobium sp. TaxID=2815319 RepID=UPI002FDE45EC